MKHLRLFPLALAGLFLGPIAAPAVTIDATALTSPTFTIDPALQGSLPTNALQDVPLGAGTYTFKGVEGAFAFEVDERGRVGYDPALAAFLDGSGTTTLVVRGFTMWVDLRGMAGPFWPFFHLSPLIENADPSVVHHFVAIPGYCVFMTSGTVMVIRIDSEGHYQDMLPFGSFNAMGNGTSLFTVDNHRPEVTITSPTSEAIAIMGTTVSYSGTFSDSDADQWHGLEAWVFGSEPRNGANPADPVGTVDEGTHTWSASSTFGEPGVFTVVFGLNDQRAFAFDTVMVVIEDPNSGFVTAGGSMVSPVGAYAVEPTLGGTVEFAFGAKLPRGGLVPKGEARFKLVGPGLELRSTSYQWLVIAGNTAYCKGRGTINGSGDYAFSLAAMDGGRSEQDSPDRVRLSIWDPGSGLQVYDSQPGDPASASPTRALLHGSVTMHKLSGRAATLATGSAASERMNVAPALRITASYPVRNDVELAFDLPNRSHVRLCVYDVCGREVTVLEKGILEAGRHSCAWNLRDRAGARVPPGIFFVRLESRDIENGPARSSLLKLPVLK